MSRERRVILLREESNSFKISGRDLFLKQHPYAHVGYIFMCFNLHMLQIFFCINVILKQKFLCLLFKFLKQNNFVNFVIGETCDYSSNSYFKISYFVT